MPNTDTTGETPVATIAPADTAPPVAAPQTTTPAVVSGTEMTSAPPPGEISDDNNLEPGQTDMPDGLLAPTVDPIAWDASEFVHHQKSASWYVLLTLVGLSVAGLVYFLTKDLVSTVVIVVGALLLGVYGARQPHEVQYQLDNRTLTIGQKVFKLEDFRSFSVVPEAGFSSIVFMPLKRFALLTTIYYPQEAETDIVNILTPIMPLSDFKHDAVDRLMHRIRF